jgi:hypothetical protein
MEITTRLRSGQGDFVLFAITPPRRSTPAERLPAIAHATVERLDRLDLDGLVLYDIDDERSRNPVERPFPFSPTVDLSEYRAEHASQRIEVPQDHFNGQREPDQIERVPIRAEALPE